MIKVLIDMNLSPSWATELEKAGIHAIHWSQAGKADAPDKEILDWARKNDYILFTHDLDFGALLAANKTSCPSVIQVSTQDVTPENYYPPSFPPYRNLRIILKKEY